MLFTRSPSCRSSSMKQPPGSGVKVDVAYGVLEGVAVGGAVLVGVKVGVTVPGVPVQVGEMQGHVLVGVGVMVGV